jgi:putative phosphoribosyl transferase
MFRFKDRVQAGQYLAERLHKYANDPEAVVLGLPRGGVVVAYEVAGKLGLPLDIFLVRKLGVPGYEELAMGAIASGGVRVMNEDVVRQVNISQMAIEAAVEREEQELERREKAYRDNRPRLNVEDRTVILVDDGLATGATMRAAVAALRKQRPRQIVIAVPTASPDTCEEFRAEVNDIVCAMTPTPFYAVGAWYEYFPQNTDEEVQQLLRMAHRAEKNTRGKPWTK